MLMDELESQFTLLILEIASRLERHGFFKGSINDLTRIQRQFLNGIKQNKIEGVDLASALYYLTLLVHTLNPRNRPIILVDEYDTPTSFVVQEGYFPEVTIRLNLSLLAFSYPCRLTHFSEEYSRDFSK
jgi:hypothetical protein